MVLESWVTKKVFLATVPVYPAALTKVRTYAFRHSMVYKGIWFLALNIKTYQIL